MSGVFQYYEMSYGLNIEMHKQVSELQVSCSKCLSPPLSSFFPYTPEAFIIITASFFWPAISSTQSNLYFTGKSVPLSLFLFLSLYHCSVSLSLMDLYSGVMLWRR